MDRVQKKVTSKDGTTIAYEQSGKGPAVILVASALSDRSDTTKLAKILSEQFTVINYDRRGRGKSGDAKHYTPLREIEDIEALIDAVGGSACIFGSSSGSVLALDAANKLPTKIKKVVMFEPPFIINNSRPSTPSDFVQQINKLIAANRRSDAVKLFFANMGIPAIGIFFMRWLMPGWSKSVAMAHTIAYDMTILEGTQAGKPLPTTRWAAISSPTLVLTGEKSEAFFHEGAKALANMLPNTEHRILKGQHHGSVIMAPQVIASVMIKFLKAEKS